MGLDPSSLSKTLLGKRNMSLEEAAQLAIILSEPITEILAHAGLDVRTVRHKAPGTVPIEGSVDASHTITALQRSQARVNCPRDIPENCVAFVYQTAQTKMDNLDGWILYAEPLNGSVAPECIDRLCVVRVRGGRKAVGFVRRGMTPGTYHLWDYDGQVLKDSQLEAGTPVLLIKP